MKKIGLLFAGMFFVSAVMVNAALAADKFAYVDLSKIFSQYKKTQDYDKDLSSKEESYTKERDQQVNEIKKLQDKLSLLNDKEKDSKKGEIENKMKLLQDFDREKQMDLRKEQDEKMKEILKDIEDTVKSYAEKEGYTLVFNDRVLVYQDKKMDITDAIIKLLSKGYKKK